MKNILVVDDDQDSCELLREIFSAEGWHVDTALSPSQAFRLAEKEKIDLVVSDVNLEANQSGLDLLKDLRSQCPVILVTGFGTLDSAVDEIDDDSLCFAGRAFERGANLNLPARRHRIQAVVNEIQEELL